MGIVRRGARRFGERGIWGDDMKHLWLVMIVFACGAALARPAEAQPCTSTAGEMALWNGLQNTNDPQQLITFKRIYPQSCVLPFAKNRFDQIFPPKPFLAIYGQSSSGFPAVLSGNGGDVDAGGGRSIQAMSMAAKDLNVALGIELMCDAGGRGVSDWLPNGTVCPTAPSNQIQGFQAQLTGVSAPYYSISYTCRTPPAQNFPPTAGWCGVHGGTPTYVTELSVTVARSPQCDFDSPDVVTKCPAASGIAPRQRP